MIFFLEISGQEALQAWTVEQIGRDSNIQPIIAWSTQEGGKAAARIKWTCHSPGFADKDSGD